MVAAYKKESYPSYRKKLKTLKKMQNNGITKMANMIGEQAVRSFLPFKLL